MLLIVSCVYIYMYIYIYVYMYIYMYIYILCTYIYILCIYIIIIYMHTHHRRKFRSQTSDNMGRWKSRGGKSQRREEKRREETRREEKRRRDETRRDETRRDETRREEKRKVAKHCFSQYFAALEGRKVGSLKQRVRRHLVGWDQKVQAAVARNTCGSQNVKDTAGSEHFWKLRCWKSARCCGAKHIKLKC